MQVCSTCKCKLSPENFSGGKKTCNKCVKKYLKQSNNFWVQYPQITKCVDPKVREEHPKLTTASGFFFDLKCNFCEKVCSICPKEFLQSGFCPTCHKYLISLDKESLQNATIETIISSNSLDDYLHNIRKFKPVELGFIQEFFSFLFFNIHKHLFNIGQYISYSLSEDKSKITSLGLPKNDLGTDSVIIHTDGEISLIQVKWRSEQTCHNRSVFAGMSIDALGCKLPVKHLILFSNSVNISKTLPSGEKFKYILYSDLLSMDWNFFQSNVQNYKTTGKISSIPPTITYRPWQIEAKEFVSQHSKACSVIAPCGAGKTLFAHSVIKNLKKYKVLIVVPSLQLLSQWFYNFAIQEKNTEFLLVGSQHDPTDVDVPYSLTTDKETIGEIFNNSDKKFVTICTYQSLRQVYECDFQFDLTFVDEAHLTTGTGEFTLVNKPDFKTVKKIFLTATPKIFKGTLVEKYVSMDDETKYGKQFIYSCRQAIEDGILCDYNVILGHCKDFSDKNRYDLYAKFLCRCIEENNLERVLIASNSHASSVKFYNAFKTAYTGDNKVVLMKPKATAKDKNVVLSEIHKTPMIIFNVKIFNLGTDIPSLQAVFFNGEKGSKIDIVQTAMRCLRVHPNKEKAYILVPAFYGEEMTVEEMGDYPMVRNTLAALGAQDTAIRDEIVLRAKLALEKKKMVVKPEYMIQHICLDEEGNIDLGEVQTKLYDRLGNLDGISWMIRYKQINEYVKINKCLPKRSDPSGYGLWINKQRQAYMNGKLISERIKLLKEIDGWKWKSYDTWMEKYDWTKAYYEENGCLPNNDWISHQRQAHKNKKLSQNCIDLLEQIDGWSWNQFDIIWMQRYNQVKTYYEENGCFPKRDDPSGNGNWIHTQRKNYKKNKLTQEKISLLKQTKIIV
jgi:superfamily II DNA or RNA helicase